MFNELNLMVTLPKLVTEFLQIEQDLEFHDNEELLTLSNHIEEIIKQVIKSNYNLIIHTKNDLYQAYHWLQLSLTILHDHVSNEMIDRGLLGEGRFLSSEEVKEMENEAIEVQLNRRKEWYL
jgi:hypothetical protein